MVHSPMFDFVKIMFAWGFDISDYLKSEAITDDEFKEIKGEATN